MNPADPPHRDAVAAVVKDVIGTILPGVAVADITEDVHPRDLGADSVDRVEIILSILDRMKLAEPMSSFSSLPDIGALIDFLILQGSGR